MQFKSWDSKGKTTDYPHFLDYQESMLLNLIAQTYHSGFGYHLDEHYVQDDEMLCNLKHDIISADGDENMVILNTKLAEKTSKKSYLHHGTIVLRLDAKSEGSNWAEKPSKVNKTWFRKKEADKEEYWYNLPSCIFVSGGKKIKMVGPLTDRSYIKVIDEFEEIKLCSTEKGKRLTVDDVLFACRGLCADDTRSIQGFNVLSDTGSVLTLKVNIDNWST